MVCSLIVAFSASRETKVCRLFRGRNKISIWQNGLITVRGKGGNGIRPSRTYDSQQAGAP